MRLPPASPPILLESMFILIAILVHPMDIPTMAAFLMLAVGRDKEITLWSTKVDMLIILIFAQNNITWRGVASLRKVCFMHFRMLFRSTSILIAGATYAFWEYCPFTNVVVSEEYMAIIAFAMKCK